MPKLPASKESCQAWPFAFPDVFTDVLADLLTDVWSWMWRDVASASASRFRCPLRTRISLPCHSEGAEGV